MNNNIRRADNEAISIITRLQARLEKAQSATGIRSESANLQPLIDKLKIVEAKIDEMVASSNVFESDPEGVKELNRHRVFREIMIDAILQKHESPLRVSSVGRPGTKESVEDAYRVVYNFLTGPDYGLCLIASQGFGP